MEPIFWNELKAQYYDWRTWDYLSRHMKKEARGKLLDQNTLQGHENSSLPYINKPGITFSIDDSFRIRDWYEYGKDMFGFYDVNVTFNINAHHHYEGKRKHSQEEINMLLELQANGHEMAHHGFNHLNAITYTEKYGMKKWMEDDILSMFDWMEQQAHSKTEEKFKKPMTFAFPYFEYTDQTIQELLENHFKIVRGNKKVNNLIPFQHTGFAPSICIDSLYLKNPRNIKSILKFVKKSGQNLIFTCHSLLPKKSDWIEYGWEMSEHEKKWRIPPKNIRYIIDEARKLDLEFYTTAELAGVASFIDRNFEEYIRKILLVPLHQSIKISDVISIKELNLQNLNITNLDGIQYFLNLEKLNIEGNQIADFRLLKKLPKLKSIQK